MASTQVPREVNLYRTSVSVQYLSGLHFADWNFKKGLKFVQTTFKNAADTLPYCSVRHRPSRLEHMDFWCAFHKCFLRDGGSLLKFVAGKPGVL